MYVLCKTRVRFELTNNSFAGCPLKPLGHRVSGVNLLDIRPIRVELDRGQAGLAISHPFYQRVGGPGFEPEFLAYQASALNRAVLTPPHTPRPRGPGKSHR
jgi:hypothetical protein